ncbi:MAG: PhzF family phenazine biosynthesis protein [Chlamydiota bacterium]
MSIGRAAHPYGQYRIEEQDGMTQPPRRFSLLQLDVFTATALEGNSLAVFPDARGLSGDEMQALAREMNLSETTFILPRDPAVERERGVQVRIFTVREELPFAGHPTLGTAFVRRASSGAPEVALDLKVGKIPVRFEDQPGQPAFGEMRQRDPEFGPLHDRQAVASATGLKLEEIADDVPIQTVSTGLPFIIVPLRSLATTQRLMVDWRRAGEYLERTQGHFFYFVCRETVDPRARVHARMFFYNGEDPATGSAAGCAAAWMAAHGVARPGERVLIEQGGEMKRPSRIFVRADKDSNRVVNVRVGGNAVEVLRGEVVL